MSALENFFKNEAAGCDSTRDGVSVAITKCNNASGTSRNC